MDVLQECSFCFTLAICAYDSQGKFHNDKPRLYPPWKSFRLPCEILALVGLQTGSLTSRHISVNSTHGNSIQYSLS